MNTKYPTISQMMPYQMRVEFFRRVCGRASFADRQFFKRALRAMRFTSWTERKLFPWEAGSKQIRFTR